MTAKDLIDLLSKASPDSKINVVSPERSALGGMIELKRDYIEITTRGDVNIKPNPYTLESEDER